MRPTRGFIDELYRERVLRARATPPEEKLFAGPDLFEFACSTTRAGIRDQFPGADDEEIEQNPAAATRSDAPAGANGMNGKEATRAMILALEALAARSQGSSERSER